MFENLEMDIIETTCSIMWYFDCELRFHVHCI